MDKEIFKKLEALSQSDLYDLLAKAGIKFPDTNKKDLTKEELLLIADEADMEVLEEELAEID